jgi:allophanate hydrolase
VPLPPQLLADQTRTEEPEPAMFVPACRSLDCVSVLALSAHDAGAVLDAAAWFDLHDPLAREASSAELRSFGPKPRFGVPPSDDLDFFGDREGESLFAAATATLEQVGGTRGKAAFAPFRDAGRLLYNGPGWPSARTQRKRFSMMIRMQCSR